MNDSRRLFIGLMADESMRDAVEDLRSTWLWPAGARMVPRHNLHLTLNFLGDVEMLDEASLVEALSEVIVPELQLKFRSTAVWHDGVVVLLAEGSAELDALQQSTSAAVSAAGVEIDPRWTPHVTLARHAAAVHAPAEIAALVWAPQAMSLVWSRREASGYEVVRSWPAVTGPDLHRDSPDGS
ncbi:RNA 2',3'-cyclic phosphodiesterase [Rhizobacter sp. SG703]|uniref:RNA 2',3'-cyclic phosphodiesterase n=1 Tax=Rhizobacter sp. SG703 TaxID=2587140 RepID=UPI001447E434|nr:RNA 2',3'-cyclic phosphodiesterase [Rhizobacter sp. SG703]NKI97522.1 2'-5' RNA ligase [Rhizobacter sp. SG703]